MSAVDRDRLVDLLRRLVATNSVNPSLLAGAPGEGAVADLIAAECRAAGLEVRLDDVGPGRRNVVARARGSRSGRRLLMNGHMDTVATTGLADPFSGATSGARLYGRGA
ncbi:MAG: acetylornithine deacetylase, partial [Armatimonadetes bacterium]|nr:acetylornithine deacetylase [Armatimonadota bacterium]